MSQQEDQQPKSSTAHLTAPVPSGVLLSAPAKSALLALFVACSLTGCFAWDMDAAAWAKAEELCKPFGGLVAADTTRGKRGRYWVTALCRDSQRVEVSVKGQSE